MTAWLRIGLLLVLAILAAGMGLTFLMKLRADSNRESARESLRQLSLFALTARPDVGLPRSARDNIPPATVLALHPVPERLSWVVDALPVFDQRRQDAAPILQQIHQDLRWNAPEHQAVAAVPIRVLLCPASPATVPPGQPAVTQFVGLTGLGDDAGVTSNLARAGAFAYSAPTPLASFADGTSQTLLFMETNRQLGPWLQGGKATARSVPEDSPTAFGDRFGGVHPGGAFVAYADGHVEFMNETIHPPIFRMLATRSGGVQPLTEIVE